MLVLVVFAIFSYLLGSFPSAYLAGRIFRGIDIREYGSGNVGATNVMRTVSKPVGLVVFFADAAKGFIAVAFLPALLESLGWVTIFPAQSMNFRILLSCFVLAGHVWPAFLAFKGGKGVATTFGIMLFLSPVLLLASFGMWLVTVLIWKYVSLSSMVASISLPIFSLLMGEELSFVIFCSALCIASVLGHRSNIRRLILGTEPKIVKSKNS